MMPSLAVFIGEKMRTKEQQRKASRKHYYKDVEASREKSRHYSKLYRDAHPERRKEGWQKWVAKGGNNTPERLEKMCQAYDRRVRFNMWYRAKYRATKQGLPFNITIDDISIPEVCPVFGTRLKITHELRLKVGNRPKSFGSLNSPSLDRIKPELGYVKGNIEVLSARANGLKNNGTIEEFEKILVHLKAHREREQHSEKLGANGVQKSSMDKTGS